MRSTDSVEKAQCVAGVLTNAVLLYCIRRYTRTSLGAYKQLLTIFASVDLCLCAIHGVIEPKLASFYVTVFSVPFTLMNIHFLYRYWTVSRPHHIRLFSSPPFIALLALIPAGECALWYVLCIYGLSGEEYDGAVEWFRAGLESREGANLSKGWIVMDWNNPSNHLLACLVVYDIVIIASLGIALTLGILTFLGI